MSKVKTTVQNLKVLIFTLLLYTFSITVLAAPVTAQTTSPSATDSSLPTANPSTSLGTSSQQLTAIPPTSPQFTDMLAFNVFHTFSCLSVGQSVIGQPCLTYQLTRNAQGMVQGVPVLSSVDTSGGVLGTTTSLIGALYANPPVRTADYLASLGQGLGIVKEADAQVVGSGAAVLSPIFNLWKVSRNISYVIMVIIFVIIGIMVMFRQRINPQTVITAQAALPGLVIGLILITFSYFLAGLITDTAFVGTNLVGYYFSKAINPSNHPEGLVSDLANNGENVVSIFARLSGIMSRDKVQSALDSIWNYLYVPNPNPGLDPLYFDPQRILVLGAMFIASQFILPFGSLGGGIGQLIGGVTIAGITAEAPTFVVGIALSFIATLVLIYAMFRLLLRLINNFLSIIWLTLSAPFQFLAAALPGRQGLATSWILHMISNVLAFPAVIAVFYFVAFLLGKDFGPLKVSDAGMMTGSFIPQAFAQTSTSASIIGSATLPLLGGIGIDFVKALLAFGALVATPAIPDIIARSINAASQAGQLIGQEIGGAVGQGRGYAGQFQQGPAGFAQQVGRVPGEKGLVLRKEGDRLFWDRPAPGNIQEQLAGGTRAGQGTRFIQGVKDIGYRIGLGKKK